MRSACSFNPFLPKNQSPPNNPVFNENTLLRTGDRQWPYQPRHGTGPLTSARSWVDVFLVAATAVCKPTCRSASRSNGLSLYYNCSGGLDYRKMIRNINPFRIRKKIRELPVEQYDLVINDFEYITAAACRLKQVPLDPGGPPGKFSIKKHPGRTPPAAWVSGFCRTMPKHRTTWACIFNDTINSYFPGYQSEIREARTVDHGHITVYLPSWCEHQLRAVFSRFPATGSKSFSRETRHRRKEESGLVAG